VSRLRPQLDQRQIGRAAAEVGDEGQLLPVQAPAVLMRRRHRLVQERHVVVAGDRQRRAQTSRRQTIGLVIVAIDEPDRSADDRRPAEWTEFRLSLAARLDQDDRHQIFEPERLAVVPKSILTALIAIEPQRVEPALQRASRARAPA